jgi:hypothetical protein
LGWGRSATCPLHRAMSAFRGNPEYLTEVDRMLERAKEVTRYGKYTGIEYARFADDLVILVDAHPRHDWLMTAVEKRLREELAALQVEVNEEKSRIVDLGRGESFGFLGFDFRSRSGGFDPLTAKASQPAGSESCMWRWQHRS